MTIQPPTLMHLGNSAQMMGHRAKGTDAAIFNKVAVTCMCIMAIATATQAAREIYQDIVYGEDKPRGHSDHHSRGR